MTCLGHTKQWAGPLPELSRRPGGVLSIFRELRNISECPRVFKYLFRIPGPNCGYRENSRVYVPEELIQVPMLHVLEDHNEGVPISAHPVELDDVVMLQVSEKLSLSLKVLAGSQCGVLQCLQCRKRNRPRSDSQWPLQLWGWGGLQESGA